MAGLKTGDEGIQVWKLVGGAWNDWIEMPARLRIPRIGLRSNPWISFRQFGRQRDPRRGGNASFGNKFVKMSSVSSVDWWRIAAIFSRNCFLFPRWFIVAPIMWLDVSAKVRTRRCDVFEIDFFLEIVYVYKRKWNEILSLPLCILIPVWKLASKDTVGLWSCTS